MHVSGDAALATLAEELGEEVEPHLALSRASLCDALVVAVLEAHAHAETRAVEQRDGGLGAAWSP